MRFYFSYFYEFLTNGLIPSIFGLIIFFLPDIAYLFVDSLKNISLLEPIYMGDGNLVFRIIGIIIILLAIIYSYLKFKFSFLDLADDYLYYEEGVIAKVRKKIPYKSITDIQLKRGIFETLLGMDAIYINTAGKADYELIIKGVSIEHGDIIFQKLKNKLFNKDKS